MRPAITTHPGFISHGNPRATYPTISLSELDQTSMSVDESEKKIDLLIHDFYHKKA